MKKILEFKDVSLKRGEKVILEELNWIIEAKENWAILGLNGAGKTTMLKMIHGDLWPSCGQLEVLGNVFGKSNISLLRRKIGWVSSALQDWLHPGDLVEQIVLSGSSLVLVFMNSIQKQKCKRQKNKLYALVVRI